VNDRAGAVVWSGRLQAAALLEATVVHERRSGATFLGVQRWPMGVVRSGWQQ